MYKHCLALLLFLNYSTIVSPVRTILTQSFDDQNAYYQKYVPLEREKSDMRQVEVKYQVSLRNWSVSQTVVETEVDEKMSHNRRVRLLLCNYYTNL